MLFLTHCCIYTFWLQSLSLTALPWPPPSQSPFPHTFPLLFLKFSSASFNLKNEVPWSSSYFFIYSCLFFSSLLGCIILSIILSLNGISMLFWCFTCNSLVFLPFYTWVLGSLRNFKCVIWFIFYYFALLLPFLLKNILSTLEAHYDKTKYSVFLLTSSFSAAVSLSSRFLSGLVL